MWVKRVEAYLREHRLVEFCLVSLLFIVLVLGVTIGYGTMFCGWHFVDDHEVLEFINPVRYGQRTVWEEFMTIMQVDQGVRFRPLYYPTRYLSILLFGANTVAYEILIAVKTIITFVLLYYVGKSCGGSCAASLLFSLLSLTGYQAAVWWKLGPQEVPGSMYWAIGMLLLNGYLRNNKRWMAVLSWISFLIMCNWKESFIVLMPFVILYVIYAGKAERKGSYVQFIIARIREHWLYITASAVLFAACILIIVFVVGSDNSSGAGLSTSTSIRTIVDSYQWAFTHDLKYYYAVTLALTAILLTYWDTLKSMWREILLFAAFIGPNLLIYGKEAMAERYLIPSSIGWGLFYVIMVHRRQILSGKRRLLYQLVLLGLFVLGLRTTIIEADYYRFRGESVTTAMTYASSAAENGAKVMECYAYSNPEATRTMNSWMEYQGDLDSMYYWDENTESVYASGTSDDEELVAVDLADIDVIMAYNSDDRHYTGMCEPVREGWLEESFTKVTCGSVDIYVRNGSGLELPDSNIAYPIYY